MKKLKICLLAILLSTLATGQQNNVRKETSSLSERLNIVEKRSEKMNVFFDIHSSFDVKDEGTDDWNAAFKARQLRLEIKGNLTNKLFYRFRHRLNKSNQPSSLDNLSKATDFLYLGYHFSDKFALVGGKLCNAWGGYEFDLNPIDVYEYVDFTNHVDCFTMGINFVYTPQKGQEFILQIANARNDSFEDTYTTLREQNIEKSNFPFAYMLNWNGNLFNNLIKTRWALGMINEANNYQTYRVTLGTMLNMEKFQLAFDYMYDKSDLDRLMLASKEGSSYLKSKKMGYFENVNYSSFIAKAEYQPSQQWNIFLKGSYDTASVDNVPAFSKNYRKSYSYLAGLEYIPFLDQDFRIFMTYVGKSIKYEAATSLKNTNTNRISLGVIYKLRVF